MDRWTNMSVEIKELIRFTKQKFGLDDYYLKDDELYRHVNIFNETVYILSMEWFPNHIPEREDDGSNPDGVAVIEIDVHRKQFRSAIFVGEKSFANGVSFSNDNINEVINWVEQETKLTNGLHFQLNRELEREYYFTACIDGISVSPSGSIEIKLDHKGKLMFFSVVGEFPSKNMMQEDTYTLSFKQIEHLVKKQVKLIEFPSFEQEKIFSIYALEEIYITNDQQSTIPFEFVVDERAFVKVYKTIKWDTPIHQSFERQEIELTEDISIEQALLYEPSPDSFPITRVEQEKCITTVKNFLRKAYQNDSGKWHLKTLHRDHGYIYAILRLQHRDYHMIRRKLTIMIDPDRFEVMNFADNQMFLEMVDDFQPPAKATIKQENAYEKLKEYLELDPYYVYDFEQMNYILCGKLDCQFGVNAVTGEIQSLEEPLM